MANIFKPGGPPRMRHQREGLVNTIKSRGVHALLFDPGCLSGDTVVLVNRAGKTFRISLRDLEYRFNGGVVGGHTWREDIPTRIQRNVDGVVRLADVVRVASAGVQETFTLVTEDGRSVRATADHPFETTSGLKPLEELTPGDEILVNSGRSQRGRQPKKRYRERAGLRHHPYAYKRHSRTSPYRVAEHRLVVEAERNGLSLADYCQRLRVGAVEGLEFLSPDQHVHHIDHNPQNNDPRNLQVMSAGEHHRQHAHAGTFKHVLEQVTSVKVQSVTRWGEEETFDVTVADDPHTFIAGTFSVGNTGKTATTLDYASLLALKSPTGEARVLVLAPLAALDTWVDQAPVWVAEGVNVWAEAVGGSTQQKAEALAARGGSPFRGTKVRSGDATRSHGHRRALDLALRPTRGVEAPPARQGPDALGSDPRLIIMSVNLDAFASREKIRGTSRTRADLMVEAVRRYAPDLIVVDESHRIKGAGSNTSKALARLTPLCSRRMLLTGTVMPHSPLDVFGQWRFLEPTAFGTRMADGTTRPATFGAFLNRYAVRGGWMGKEVISFKNLDEMQEIMARNSTVAKKSEVLDLPKVTSVNVNVNLSPAERKAYKAMTDDLAVKVDTEAWSSAQNRLAQLMRLRQITSGYLPDDTGGIQQLGTSKVDTIRSIVQDTLLGENRVVIFSHFTDEIAALRAALEVKGNTVEVITGNTPATDRLEIRRRFGDREVSDRIILIAQIKTMSLAVNELVTASHAVFGSLSWQRDDYEQAVARLDRTGQTKPVTIWRAIAPGTVDEIILDSIEQRTNLESAMLRHISEGPDL